MKIVYVVNKNYEYMRKDFTRVTSKSILDVYSIITSSEFLFQILLPNEKHREIVALHWKNKLTKIQISEHLNISHGAVTNRYNTAIKKLKTRIKKLSEYYLILLLNTNIESVENASLRKQIIDAKKANGLGIKECNNVEINPKNIYIKDILKQKQFTKCINVLQKRNIHTLGNLTFYTEAEIKLFKGIGDVFVNHLKQNLKENNLQFKLAVEIKGAV